MLKELHQKSPAHLGGVSMSKSSKSCFFEPNVAETHGEFMEVVRMI